MDLLEPTSALKGGLCTRSSTWYKIIVQCRRRGRFPNSRMKSNASILSGVEQLARSGIGTDVEPLAKADALGRYGRREEASPTQPRGVKLEHMHM